MTLDGSITDTGLSDSAMRFDGKEKWPGLTVAIGLAILCDKSERPVFPRWSAWVNFWFAGLVMTGQFMLFFHRGPIAWNGALALYWPAFVFFVWICVMSALVIQGACERTGSRPMPTSHFIQPVLVPRPLRTCPYTARP